MEIKDSSLLLWVCRYYLRPVTVVSAKWLDSGKRGFTLVELVVVMAIILILIGIVSGVSSGVRDAQARATAKAELAVLSLALERFKSVHGDYPWIDEEPHELLKSLIGRKEFSGSGTSARFEDISELPQAGAQSFIELSQLSVADSSEPEPEPLPIDELSESPDEVPEGWVFTDPWGNPYVYIYRTGIGGAWENFGYVLFSQGPDGESEPVPGSGIREPVADRDIDNIYAGE